MLNGYRGRVKIMSIKNLWENITIYCECHDEPVQMTATMHGTTLYYECSKPCCTTKITTDDFQKVVEKISDEITQCMLNNEQHDFEGMKWSKKGVNYKIFEYNSSCQTFKVSAINKR